MKRTLTVILASGVVFALTVVIAMGVTGNLNVAAFNRLLGRDEAPAAKTKEQDVAGAFAQALREKEERLDEREREMDERDERLAQRQRILDDTLADVQQIQAEIQLALDTLDNDRDERIQKAAKLLAAMNATNAAKDMEAMDPEEAAEILRHIKERNAGRILDAMEPRKRTLVHQHLQERKY